ncbi:LacI family DNA-binding transcriptional regulator [Inquilinus limosus]|uniref:LacI family DNA-binding transcriptional regulator n=1 Tax=Inquilinus limosus TaxID=171674 RepID=UPI003F16AA4D
MADVAAYAGVGMITVSRVLREPHRVSETLQRVVNDAIRELNYVPNLSARALASTRSGVIGVLVPSLTQVVFADVLRGIYDGVDGTDLQIQVANTRYDPLEEERLIGVFLRQKPSAMIVSGIDQTANARRMLEKAGCPVVQIMDLSPDPIDRIIGFSHEDAGRRMTEHLIEQGYTRVAFLSGWMNNRSAGRRSGYQRALAAAGLDRPGLVHSISNASLPHLADKISPATGRPMLEFATPALGRELFRRAIVAEPRLDAVFCNNDILALGVLFECVKRGIRVPEDMGIAGFNDLDFMEAAEPSLSSVRTYRYRIGHAAVAAIRDQLAGRPAGERIVDLGTEIMKRRSTDRRHVLSGQDP